jgi:hypothetical protein
MADTTAPSTTTTGEISLATMQQLNDINSRISTLTEIIKKVQAFQVSEAVEAVQLETNRMKEKFIKDIEDLKEASREVSSGFNTALLDIQSTIRDMNSRQFNAISDIRSFVGDMTRATNEEMKEFNEQFQKMLEDGAVDSGEALKKYDALVTERTGKLKDELNQNLSAAKDTMLSFTQMIETEMDSGVDLGAIKEKYKTFFTEIGGADTIANFDQLNEKLLEFKEATLGGSASTLESKYQAVIKDTLEIGKQTLKAKLEAAQIQKAENDELKKNLELKLRLLTVDKMRQDSQTDLITGMDSLVGKLTLSSDRTNIFSSALKTVALNTDGAGAGFKGLATIITTSLTTSLLDPEKALNRFFNFMEDKLVKSSFEYSKSLAEINKQTGGFASGFEKMAMTGGGMSGFKFPELGVYGVSVKQLAETYSKLSTNLVQFNNLSTQQQEVLAKGAASFQTLGVSIETYSKISSAAMSALGKTADGVAEMFRQLSKDALALGEDLNKYASNYEQSMSKIIGFSRESTEIFKELSGAAKAAGLSTSDVLSLAERFQTFDSGAESIMKLNAAFGDLGISQVELMRMDPAQVITRIKQATDGIRFDQLNIGYKRLVAELFGGDVKKAAEFFNTSLDEMEEKMLGMSATESEMEEKRRASVDALQKMNVALDNLNIVMTPVYKIVGAFADGFLKIEESVGSVGAFLTMVSTLAIPVGYGIYRLIQAARDAKTQLVASFTEISASIERSSLHLQQFLLQLENVRKGTASAATVVGPSGPMLPPTGGTAGGTGGGGRFGGGAMLGLMAAGMLIPTIIGATQKETPKDDFVISSGPSGVKAFENNGNDVVGAKPMGAIDVSLRNAKTFGDAGMTFVQSVLPQTVAAQKYLVSSVERLVTAVFSTITGKTIIDQFTASSSSTSTGSSSTFVKAVETNTKKVEDLSFKMQRSSEERTKEEQRVFTSALQPAVAGGSVGAAQAAAANVAQVKFPDKVQLSATFRLPGMSDSITETVVAKLHSKV